MSIQPLSVVVPVYRDLRATRTCLESVLETIDVATPLYVVNDGSPESALTDYCRELAKSGRISLIENKQNLGFVKSVNVAMEAAGDADCVLLNSDTQVPPGWLDRLQRVAADNPRAASITPFSNNATICSYPTFCEDNPLPADLDAAALDALFQRANAGKTVELPTGVGFCMYVRRSAWLEVGPFDEEAFGRGYGEENDWCMRASRLGWKHVLCADLFVYHAGGASFGGDAVAWQNNALTVINERYPNYNADIARFVEQDPAEPLRFSVDLLRPDAASVIGEVRARAKKEREARYAVDLARHQQVTALDQVLQETRRSAAAESEQYRQLLNELRSEASASTQQFQEREQQYLQQIAEMAEGYEALRSAHEQLNQAHQQLTNVWFIRVWRALRRGLGMSP